MKTIKLLIVDDSILFRSQIQVALTGCPGIEIVGAVSNGKNALELMKIQEIDVCILDIEMPVMDGLETIRQMKALSLKTKAIMFSSQSTEGANKTMEAMNMGAVDFVSKPIPDKTQLTPADKIREALLPKINSIFGLNGSPIIAPAQKKNHSHFIWEAFHPEVLVIASSTGGPAALVDFFSMLKDPLPFPILVTQHMPPVFTTSLAERLGKICDKKAAEGVHGEILVPNQIYVAPGNFHMQLTGDRHVTRIELNQAPQRNYVRPCADFLFETAAQIFGSKTMGVVLTGMGRDGADGASEIKSKNGGVLIQSEESCVVFGMPGAVFAAQDFDFSGHPADLARKVLSVSKLRKTGHVA